MYSKELELAKELAVEAGAKILEIYNQPIDVEYKQDNSPLTKADSLADKIIVDGLKKSFPTYAVLSEESRDDLSRLENDFCFIVDPLDGTKEFIKRNGEFTVNIALTFKHVVVMGVIYVPVTGELYFASKSDGSFYVKDGKVSKLSVSGRNDDLRLVMSRSHGSDTLDKLIEKYEIKNIKSAGSSLKGCLIAKGEAEVYYRFGLTMEWDTAAMQCIVEEAGGIFRQSDGTEMLYNRENSLNEKGFFAINNLGNDLTQVLGGNNSNE